MKMNQKLLLKFLFILNLIIIFSNVSHAKPISQILISNQTVHTTTHPWQSLAHVLFLDGDFKLSPRFLLAGILSFLAAAISSAGGTGGGGLFIPIMTIVAGVDLKTASSYSTFMVTGGSIACVACQFFAKRGRKPLIDFDVALLSEPCMLLGVSLGVICNVMLPEWLITTLFAIFLAFCTFKTCNSGVKFWKRESEGMMRNVCLKMENEEPSDEGNKQPLLSNCEEKLEDIPRMKLGMLVLIWFSFFVVYLLRGNRYGKGIIDIETCGTRYWIISSVQIPLAIIFTAGILYGRKCTKNAAATHQGSETRTAAFGKPIFPIMAFLAGVLGGVFGIGGGLLISPLLLQMGMQPQVTAATCSFMVLFSSSMSAIEYLFLGMEHIYGALTFSAVCFVASLVGLTLLQRAIMKHGRASLIVFSVGTVMALSTVLMTSYGAVAVWRDYTSGNSMGFKKPC